MTSSDDLVQTLEDINEEINTVKKDMYNTIQSFYSTQQSRENIEEALKFAKKWQRTLTTSTENGQQSGSSNKQSKVDLELAFIEKTLSETIAKLQFPTSAANPLEKTLGKYNELSKQIELSEKKIKLIQLLSNLDELFHLFDELMQRHDFSSAGGTIQQMGSFIGRLLDQAQTHGDGEEDDDRVFTLMKNQYRKRRTHFLFQLKQTLEEMLVFKEDSKMLVVNKEIHKVNDVVLEQPILFVDVWNGLLLVTDEFSADKLILEKVIDSLQTFVLKPFVDDMSMQLTISLGTTESNLMLKSRKNASTTSGDNFILENLFDNTQTLLNFLCSEVFISNPTLVLFFKNQVWRNENYCTKRINLCSLLQSTIKSKIPEEMSGLKIYQSKVQKKVSDLEKQLKSLKFFDPEEDTLSKCVIDINRYYSQRKRNTVLEKARVLLTKGYCDSIKVSDATERSSASSLPSSGKGGKSGIGKDSNNKAMSTQGDGVEEDDDDENSFSLPRYRVSRCTHDLVELAHQSLIDASNISQNDSDDQSTLDENNTCEYASLLWKTARDIFVLFRAIISTLHKQDIESDARTDEVSAQCYIYFVISQIIVLHRLPTSLQSSATMIDMVPSFREFGETSLSNFTQIQSKQFLAAIETCPSVGLLHMDDVFNQTETCVKSVVFKLNRISSFWQEGLPKKLYNSLMEQLISPILQCFIDNILKETDVSASASRELQYLMGVLIEVGEFFESEAVAEESVKILLKFKKIKKFLNERLEKISEQYESGQFYEFAPEELVRLLRAYFPNTVDKNQVIHKIQEKK